MTSEPNANSDTSNLPTVTDVAGGRSARLVTEPLREAGALGLLAANAVFLFLGVTGLLLVVDGWATDFGLRSARTYAAFVGGPIPVGFPLLAVLLATHVQPVVPRAKMITLAAAIEYGVSAFFGAVTFLGAFANDLVSVRSTVEGMLFRLTWAGLLAFAALVTLRLWLGLFYVPRARPAPFMGYPTTYGQPYPGQPMYPNPAYAQGQAEPVYAMRPDPTSGEASGWPAVPPPPMPAPIPPSMQASDLTQRVAAAPQTEPETAFPSGDATQRSGFPPTEPPTRPLDR